MDNPLINNKSLGIAFLLVALAYIDAAIIAFLIGWATGDRNPILIAFTADIAATLAIYAWARVFRNASFYDPYWSVAPIAIAVFWVTTAAVTASSCRPWIVIALVVLWSLRLTWNWARGWRGLKHEDWRYADMRTKHSPKKRFWIVELVGIELVPTLVVFLGCLSLYPVLADATKTLWWPDYIAALVTAAAILIETTADEQMLRFVKTKKPGEIMDKGLWRYSRHPNYFGEISFWWGLYFFGLAANPSYWWTVAGPIAITLLFLFISIPMMDKRSKERRPEYAEHMKKTSALVPQQIRQPDKKQNDIGPFEPLETGMSFFLFSITIISIGDQASWWIRPMEGLTLGLSLCLLVTVGLNYIDKGLHCIGRFIPNKLNPQSFIIKFREIVGKWNDYIHHLTSPSLKIIYGALFIASWFLILNDINSTGRAIIVYIGFAWFLIYSINSWLELFGVRIKNTNND